MVYQIVSYPNRGLFILVHVGLSKPFFYCSDCQIRQPLHIGTWTGPTWTKSDRFSVLKTSGIKKKNNVTESKGGPEKRKKKVLQVQQRSSKRKIFYRCCCFSDSRQWGQQSRDPSTSLNMVEQKIDSSNEGNRQSQHSS